MQEIANTPGDKGDLPDYTPIRAIVAISRRVLLLVDVQSCRLIPPPVGIPRADIVCSNLVLILRQARNTKPPPLIIHVRNVDDVGDSCTPGWQLIFPTYDTEVICDKLKNNAFAGTQLNDVIPLDAEIVVAGFQTEYSIRATCSAALGRGNEVSLIRGAHATYDRDEMEHGGGMTPAWRIEAETEAELEEAGVHLLDMKDLQRFF